MCYRKNVNPQQFAKKPDILPVSRAAGGLKFDFARPMLATWLKFAGKRMSDGISDWS